MNNMGTMAELIEAAMKKKEGGKDSFMMTGQYASPVMYEEDTSREYVIYEAPNGEEVKVYGSWNEYAVSVDDEGRDIISDIDFPIIKNQDGDYILDAKKAEQMQSEGEEEESPEKEMMEEEQEGADEEMGMEEEHDFFLCVSTLGAEHEVVYFIAVQFDAAAIIWGGRRDLLSPALETGLLERQRRIETYLGLDTRILYVDTLAEAWRDPDAPLNAWVRRHAAVLTTPSEREDENAYIPDADAPRRPAVRAGR